MNNYPSFVYTVTVTVTIPSDRHTKWRLTNTIINQRSPPSLEVWQYLAYSDSDLLSHHLQPGGPGGPTTVWLLLGLWLAAGRLLFLALFCCFIPPNLYQFIIKHIALWPPVTSTGRVVHNGIINLANFIKPVSLISWSTNILSSNFKQTDKINVFALL